MNRDETIQFPPTFTWGVATSSYQIEGAVEADGRKPSIWDTFCQTPGAIADRSSGAEACDHYHRYRDDVSLMADLHAGAYRFSIAWPRVIPDGVGSVNEAGLDFYDRLVDELLANGIVPLPTLYHWDLPQALGDTGGWLSRDTAGAFADYAEAVASRLGDRVSTWMTLNEPFCSAHVGYFQGRHAPGHTDFGEALTASHHLLLAHGMAVDALRAAVPDAQVGIVLNFTPKSPATDSAADAEATELQNMVENDWYADAITGRGYPHKAVEHHQWDRREVLDGDMEQIARPLDVLGVNFYTRGFISTDPAVDTSPRGPITEMGWEVHPPSLRQLLGHLHERYGFPRYVITENGAAMPDRIRDESGRVDDQDRLDYYDAHLRQVHAAIGDGVPVEGYLAWSFMDNFEWGFGYEKRFGIVEVDYETQERIPKRSALWYADVMASGAIGPYEGANR